jgi:hypothetical protein
MENQEQETRELQLIKLLQIFHYIWGALSCFVGLIGVAYIFLGSALFSSMNKHSEAVAFPAIFAVIWYGMIVLLVVLCEVGGVLSLLAAQEYGKQKSYWVCFTAAVINCLAFPVGTALGVFALWVLIRPSIKTLFGATRRAS